MNNLTLLIPVKNEKESLGIFFKKLEKFNYKKLVIVDKNDKTNYQELIKKSKNIKIYTSKKTGYGSALIEGINQINSKYFCIINADGSMDPNDIRLNSNQGIFLVPHSNPEKIVEIVKTISPKD